MELQVKPQIEAVLDKYQKAIRERNLQQVADCYAPAIDAFYRGRNITRTAALTEIERNFSSYPVVGKLSISKLEFDGLTRERAEVSFDKEWEFSGSKFFAGKERQQMIFLNLGGKWVITSETELEVFWTRRQKHVEPVILRYREPSGSSQPQ